VTSCAGTAFVPREQHAEVRDDRSVALVGSDGSVDWWCVPSMDCDPLFERLLNQRSGGVFSSPPWRVFVSYTGVESKPTLSQRLGFGWLRHSPCWAAKKCWVSDVRAFGGTAAIWDP
jgi:hypothetical protein